jgi:hypothetical protein
MRELKRLLHPLQVTEAFAIPWFLGTVQLGPRIEFANGRAASVEFGGTTW